MIPTTPDELVSYTRQLCDEMSAEDDWLKRDVLSHAGNRWAFAIIMALKEHGTLRHAALRRRLNGVTQRMLTRTLRQLERDHLITRHDRAEIPPHVEYSLTPLGEEFLIKVIPVWLWIFDNADAFRHPEPAPSEK